MELVYPFIIYIGLPLLIILIVFEFKKGIFKEGKKIANTKYVVELPYYKEIMKKYKILSYMVKVLAIVSIFMSLVLLARPAVWESSSPSMYNRDIILCMDVSDSVNSLNEDLVENLKKVVKGLKGERFGITIFNTSSVMLVPLTDDYNYVLEMLDTLQRNLKIRNDFLNSNSDVANDEVYYATEYIFTGTLVGNEDKGSSVIGDGLASCVYGFGDLNEERTRVVIFSTDNELFGTELITLMEAGTLCKNNDITVFGIAPRTITEKAREELKDATQITGGNYYEEGTSNVSDIIDSIEKKGKSLINGKKEVKLMDKPEIPFIILILSICGLFILNKKVEL